MYSGIDYARPSQPQGLLRLSGGLNSSTNGLNLQDSEATDILNIDFDVFGSIKKRKGYTTLNSSAFNSGATWTGLYWTTLGGTDYLMGTCGDKIAKMDSLDGTWDDITGGLTVTAGNNNLFSFTTLSSVTIGTNGVDAPFKWTGTGNAAAADVPTGLSKAKFTTSWNNYAFYANVTVSATNHPTRIYWSNLKDPTTWTATDFVDIDVNDGKAITGIMPLGDRIVIFKETSIHIGLFTGDSDVPFVFKKTPSHVGCASGYSLEEIDNGIVFVNEDGHYFFDGQNSIKLSDRINQTILGFTVSRFQYCQSAYLKTKHRQYMTFTASGGSTHSIVVTWDSVNNAYSYYTGLTPNVFAIVRTSGEERIYFGDYAGYVYRADTGTSDNPAGTETAISAYWKSKWFNFSDIVDKKAVTHLAIYHQLSESTLRLGYAYDFDSSDSWSQTFAISAGGSLYGSGIYGLSSYALSGGNVIRRDLTGRGRVFRISFYNDVLDQEFQIDGIGFYPHNETVA